MKIFSVTETTDGAPLFNTWADLYKWATAANRIAVLQTRLSRDLRLLIVAGDAVHLTSTTSGRVCGDSTLSGPCFSSSTVTDLYSLVGLLDLSAIQPA